MFDRAYTVGCQFKKTDPEALHMSLRRADPEAINMALYEGWILKLLSLYEGWILKLFSLYEGWILKLSICHCAKNCPKIGQDKYF